MMNGTNSLMARLHRWQLVGWVIIVSFVGGGLAWASIARLDSAAVAHGVVATEGNRKTVAHLEGGIVADILVTQGEAVSAGEPLIVMDDTRARATLALLQARFDAALAREARLQAERSGSANVTFPKELMRRARDPEIAKLLAGEESALRSRRGSLTSQRSIFRERIAMQNSEIVGLRAQLSAAAERRKLLGEELAMMEPLFKKGLVAKGRVLSIKRNIAETDGDMGDLHARIAKAGETISELKMQLALPGERRLNDVNEDYQKTRERIAELREKIRAAEDLLGRTIVRAPIDGFIFGLQAHTPGGVVQPGERLLDLVPENDRVVIDLRIDPRDIDAVYRNMPALVRLGAFNMRTTPLIGGKVSTISADRTVDPRTGISYFEARVIPDLDAPGFDLSRLTSGMQAEVYLVNAERTVLDYVIEPVLRSFARAGREF
ncbi:MAG: HlyD family type I secretion periplasmic adaptor subunit [Rhodospirillales bacterium]|nr:HlyD family type I secretion periplasmic adaptor subunit [Rhodospirillales bacterium]